MPVALITRPIPEAFLTAELLRQRGFEPLISPILEISILPSAQASLTDELKQEPIQAILVTSRNGARVMAEIHWQRDIPVIAVGDATAAMLKERGYNYVMSADGDGRALIQYILEHCQPQKGWLIHVSGNHIAVDLTSALESQGFKMKHIQIYASTAVEKFGADTLYALQQEMVDVVLFYSVRTAEVFCQLLQQANLVPSLHSVQAYCLSKAIAGIIKPLPWLAVHVAEVPTQEALFKELDNFTGSLPTSGL